MNDKLRINNEITNYNSKRGKDPSMEANHKHGRNVQPENLEKLSLQI